MEHSDDLRTRVELQFPNEIEEICALLDDFHAEIAQEEREKVLHAVLSLSGDKRAKLERYLKVAARDYREVLIMLTEGDQSREN